MDFTKGFTDMFLNRFETGGYIVQLQQCETYRIAVSEFDEARKQADGDNVNAKAVDQLMAAFGRLANLEAQYLYRVGMQDGLSMARPDFLTANLVY